MFYEVIPAKSIGNSSVNFLTYSSEESLEPGTIVLVPLRRAKIPGIVIKKVPAPKFEAKKIEKILYEEPLPRHLIKSLLWLSEYYLNPLPSVASAMLPSGIEKTRRSSITKSKLAPSSASIPLNSAQEKALARIKTTPTATKLLFGITGSGKTNIYLALAKETLKNHQSVILLVPEIALTSQLVQIFEQTFKSDIVLLHSRQTDATRHQLWERILKSELPQIIIGPRSALFAQLKTLGSSLSTRLTKPLFTKKTPPVIPLPALPALSLVVSISPAYSVLLLRSSRITFLPRKNRPSSP